MSGLPINADVQSMLLMMNKVQNNIIVKLYQGVNEDNLFAVRMSRTSVIPMLAEYKKLGDSLERYLAHWNKMNPTAPALTSEDQTPVRATGAQVRNIIEAEWEYHTEWEMDDTSE